MYCVWICFESEGPADAVARRSVGAMVYAQDMESRIMAPSRFIHMHVMVQLLSKGALEASRIVGPLLMGP